MSQENKICVYACGGAAINASSILEICRGNDEIGVAPIEIYYLDTAIANFKPTLPKEFTFVVPGKDGSGGDRRENAPDIAEATDAILAKFKPGNLNIVISSASGGSGSVIAPQLTARLIKNDGNVIPVLIGDARQGHWITNTLGTIATYEKIAAKFNTALPVGYFENTKDVPPSEVDAKIIDLIVALSIVYSRQNIGLDSRDLYNALHFDRMTSYEPHLATINWCSGVIDESMAEDIMTAISLSVDKDNTGVNALLPYAKQALMPEGVNNDVRERAPLHIYTTAYPFNDISDRLKKAKADLQDKARARTVKSTVLDGIAGGDDSDDFMSY